jgi:hypothetical protein
VTQPQRWELTPDTAFVERDGLIYLAALPDGPIVVLDQVASLILTIALEVPIPEVIAEVASAYAKGPGEVDEAVGECLSGLAAAGLLRRTRVPPAERD